jgi:hypothetical protein
MENSTETSVAETLETPNREGQETSEPATPSTFDGSEEAPQKGRKLKSFDEAPMKPRPEKPGLKPASQTDSGAETSEEEVEEGAETPEAEEGQEEGQEPENPDGSEGSAGGGYVYLPGEGGKPGEKMDFAKLVEDKLEVDLQHGSKVLTVDFPKLKSLAQQGLHTSELNRRAKEAYQKAIEAKSYYESQLETKAQEMAQAIANEYLMQYLSGRATPGNPIFDAASGDKTVADSASLRILMDQLQAQKDELDSFKKEHETRLKQSEQQREMQQKVAWARDVGNKALAKFQDKFKGKDGKNDEVRFKNFSMIAAKAVESEVEKALAARKEEDPDGFLLPEEILEILNKVPLQIYGMFRDLSNEGAADIVRVKKAPAKVAPVSGTSVAGADTGPRMKKDWDHIDKRNREIFKR